MSDVIPIEISRADGGILIGWSDGSRRQYAASKLRAACPCATCREKQAGGDDPKPAKKPVSLPVLSIAEARPLVVEKMRPVGNYAYNIAFSDGHDSGIFTFDFLHSLGEQSEGPGRVEQ